MIDLYFKRETLELLVKTLQTKASQGDEKGGAGVSLTVGVNDDANTYRQNVSASVAQTKEQRDAKAKKFFVANGKTFWSNKGEFIPSKEAPPQQTETSDEIDDLPF